LKNIPLAHITGRQNFMGIEMKVDERALIPRKETEILGQKALRLSNIISCKNEVVNIIDVCCGSGNLAIALAHYNSNTHVYASDLVDEAIELARENISNLRLEKQIELKKGDLFAPFESEEFYNKMDLIVCNPPYISTSKAKILSSTVHFEAVEAFDGGMLGISIIQRLIRESHKFLVPSGWLLFEVGEGQGDFVIKLCKNSGLYDRIEFLNNEYGQQRVICVRKK
ncbi:MAG: peptide chain release factor N(5)-glutamine methyltransferase, partial [Prolixibacteraceae bacterium]|nr:peptide chain release factor N(5)-glutamine methyltransferase [Prolixibacteraceae bacterium]